MTDEFKFGNVSGPVNAGSGNQNVGSGSQYVAGRDVTVGSTVGADPAAAEAIAAIREELARMRLTAEERAAAESHLSEMERAEDKQGAAEHLRSFVSVLKQAGAMASAGSGLVTAVTKLATWIGPLAAGALALL